MQIYSNKKNDRMLCQKSQKKKFIERKTDKKEDEKYKYKNIFQI